MGHTYTEQQKRDVWEKRKAPKTATTGYDVRRREIHWGEYGKLTKYGWQVDHIIPESKGGPHELDNWQPLHHKSNQNKSNKLQVTFDQLIRTIFRMRRNSKSGKGKSSNAPTPKFLVDYFRKLYKRIADKGKADS